MTLKELLESKPSKMITCKTTCLVADAVTVMDGHNVGSILVFDDNSRLAGIFTERDIMHCFAKNIDFKQEPIAKVMTHNPLTLEASTDINVAITVMSERKFRHLPVTEDGKIVGVVSYRHIVSHLLPDIIYMADDIC
ncbi:MAG TPA: CBS domain-containing protein [Thermodesulfovibrionales bacterium]|jgi:signal-transduction protein with cAMP-binding, CBS, and nucleotidyltransferase domain|nr:CBS domain-containing protein [Thermodesulfovibrionales bacterium]